MEPIEQAQTLAPQFLLKPILLMRALRHKPGRNIIQSPCPHSLSSRPFPESLHTSKYSIAIFPSTLKANGSHEVFENDAKPVFWACCRKSSISCTDIKRCSSEMLSGGSGESLSSSSPRLQAREKKLHACTIHSEGEPGAGPLLSSSSWKRFHEEPIMCQCYIECGRAMRGPVDGALSPGPSTISEARLVTSGYKHRFSGAGIHSSLSQLRRPLLTFGERIGDVQ